MREIIIYRCEFCNTTHEKVIDIREHEERCSFNPINKKCYTCQHNKVRFGDYIYDPVCEKNMDMDVGRLLGMCKEWESKK